jgi:hypothetical protein
MLVNIDVAKLLSQPGMAESELLIIQRNPFNSALLLLIHALSWQSRNLLQTDLGMEYLEARNVGHKFQ